MSNYGEMAKGYFSEGYNCAQAVLLAFCDETGLDKEKSALIASSFGGGMGGMREVCGAVSGMFMAAGLIYGYNESNPQAKAEHYARIQEFAERFRAKNGSIICRELLGLAGRDEVKIASVGKKRPCEELVEIAADTLGEYINGNN